MKNIQIKILNPKDILSNGPIEKLMVCSARLTQNGHKIKTLEDYEQLYNRKFTRQTIINLVKLPHPTIQKFGIINIIIVGASRRFLAQITRHQNEVKFMSASLQYSNYKTDSSFVIPYNIIDTIWENQYLKSCTNSMLTYKTLNEVGNIPNDECGYSAPQGLRNVILISATPYQWKHMISQRICRRNTEETRYVMLKCWEALYELNPEFFAIDSTGAFCQQNNCKEGKFCCGKSMKQLSPKNILEEDYGKIM